MVQLKSDLEALERCRIDPSIQLPAWSKVESLREQLDGELRQSLIDWGCTPARKALLVGASWPRLAVDMAERDMWVTVVDHDGDSLKNISNAAGDAGVLTKVTVSCSDYVQRSFEPSAFNLIVIWDTLNFYPEVEPIIRKATRELKTGGLLFVRCWVKGRAEGLLSKLKKTVKGAVDREELIEAMENHLVVQKQIPHHYSAPRAANAAAEGGIGGKLLSLALTTDKTVIETSPDLARYMAIMAAKEKHLGKVSFNLR